MSIGPELNPYGLIENINGQKPLGNSPAIPRFAEMLSNLLDRLVPPPQEIRVDREAHALLEYRISQATKALRSGEWRGLRNFHNSAGRIFGSTDLPRIAYLVTMPGSLQMVLRPKYAGRIEIMTDYMRGEVVYRITS